MSKMTTEEARRVLLALPAEPQERVIEAELVLREARERARKVRELEQLARDLGHKVDS